MYIFWGNNYIIITTINVFYGEKVLQTINLGSKKGGVENKHK